MEGLVWLVAQGGLVVDFAAAYEPFFKLVVIDRSVLLTISMSKCRTPLVFSPLPRPLRRGPIVHEAPKDSRTALAAASADDGCSALVVAQLALAMMLLIVSGLLVRTMIEINRAPLGFDRTDLLTIRMELPDYRYSDA